MSRKTIDQADHFAQASPSLIVRGTTPEQRELETLTRFALQYTREQFNIKLDRAYQNATTIQKRQAAEREAALKISEAERQRRNEPIQRFVRDIKGRHQNPDALSEWNKVTHEELDALNTEFNRLIRMRGVPLDQADQDFASTFLLTLLSKPNNEKPSFRQKLGL